MAPRRENHRLALATHVRLHQSSYEQSLGLVQTIFCAKGRSRRDHYQLLLCIGCTWKMHFHCELFGQLTCTRKTLTRLRSKI